MSIPLALLFVVALARDAGADDPAMSVRLEPPAELHVGDRAAIVAVVTFAQPNDQPLLLTPSTEGTAIEVVRGRLLRADADEESERELRFRVPLVARTSGTARLRVHVASWACANACRRIEARGETLLRVERAPSPE